MSSIDTSVQNKELVLKQSSEIFQLLLGLQNVSNTPLISDLVVTDFHANEGLKSNEISFYRIKKLSFDEDYPRREAFENVLMGLDNTAFNFVYMLTGSETGVELCFGVVKNDIPKKNVIGENFSANNLGESLANAFLGNFPGSVLEKLSKEELDSSILYSSTRYQSAGVISGVPSINEVNGSDDYDFQGIDRLVNSMLGLNWRLVIVCEPVSKEEIAGLREDVYELYNRLSVVAKQNEQKTISLGDTISFSKNTSESRGRNKGWNESKSTSKGGSKGSENSTNWNNSTNCGTSGGSSITNTSGTGSSITRNKGASEAVTIERANKHAQEIIKYIDEELLERLKLGYSKGLFKSSIYYMAEKITDANRLRTGIMSLFQGNKSSYSPLVAQKIDLKKDGNYFVLKNCQNRYMHAKGYTGDALMLMGRPFYGPDLCLGTYLNSKEISLIAGLPQKEVPGIVLREAVGFGLNEKNIEKDIDVNLGWMIQKGRYLENVPFYLKRKVLKKHTFIAGVTGSGKTTTCHRLLMESKGVPFLVLEPAKTEYRTLINSKDIDDLIVFTLGNETVAPFRINPFELVKDEIITAHVDMLKATFTSAFPMEASMPQLLEESIYKCYEDKGWNVDSNENDIYGDKAFDSDVDAFPVLSDLLETMKTVVETKGFSAQMKADYIGSLVSRLSNLTVGSKGAMLNCAHSIDFSYLAHHNVIIEMEELKSPEDKALVMGFILTRLAAVIKKEHSHNSKYEHLTLVEEAHRLLSKVDYGDGGSKKVAVETFTDLLAEVRKYGEGLIIVDQIPNKLAPEVLKNTNTKIIHKILAKDDKEAVGDTMLMDDKQKQYLSALEVGEAIVFTETTDKPVNIQVKKISDTEEEQIPNSLVNKRFLEYKTRFGKVYSDIEIIPYFKNFNALCSSLGRMKVDIEQCERFKQIVSNIAKKNNEKEIDVWHKFIHRRDLLNGMQTVEGNKYPERERILHNFFTKVFYKKDFSKKDVYSELVLKSCNLVFEKR